MKIAIIGAGVQGMANAYFLQRAGMDVTVIEAADAAGMECSFANGGGLLPATGAPWNEPDALKSLLKYVGRENAPLKFKLTTLPSMALFGLKFLSYSSEKRYINSTRLTTQLGYYSSDMMREIENETDISYRQSDSGLMAYFRDAESQAGTEAFFDLFADEGIQYESLDSSGVTKKEPSLKPIQDQITGGIFCPKERSGDPHIFCREITKHTQQNGAEYHFNTKIIDLKKENGSFRIISQDGRDFKADAVVIAAGCHSPALGKKLGLRIPIKPAKGYSLSIPMDGWNNAPTSVIGDMGLHVGINPIGGKILRVAGIAEFAGYNKQLSKKRINYLIKLVETIFPEFAATMDREQLNPWAGLRPISVDGTAILGKTPIEGLYLSTGHGGIGWTTAAGSGRVIADLISGKDPEIDISGFSINRF